MKDPGETRNELIAEVSELRQRITELEQSLHESEERFRQTVDVLPTIVVEYDLEGLVTYVNDYGYEMLGYGPSDVEKGFRVPWLLPPDEVEKHMDRLARLIKGEKVPGAEYQLIHRDGSIVHALITSAPIYKNGEVIGIRSTATDISKHKETEDALRESEHRFRMLVETMSDGLGVQDENGIITYVNQRVCELSGYSKDELMGRPATDLLEEPDRSIYAAEFAKRREGTASTYEVTWTGKDRRKISTLSSSTPIFDLEGNFKGSFAVITDITERKQAEDALRASEERYRAIVDTQIDLLCRFLPDGTLTFVNEAICQLLGQKQDEIVGQKFYKYIHPDDVEKTRRNIESISADNPVVINEERVILPDGEMRWWQWKNQGLFDDTEEIVEYQAVGRDITERVETEQKLQESEQRFRETVQLLPSIVVEYDSDFRVTYVNEAGYENLGYTPADVEQGVNIPDLFPSDEQEKLMGRLIGLLQGEETPPIEYRLMRKDGSIIHCLVSSTPIKKAGKVVGIRSSVTNITKLKLAEDRLRESEEKFRALFDHIPIMAFVVDRDHRLIAHNSVFFQKMGDQGNRRTLDLSDVTQSTKEFWHSVEEQVIESGQPTWYVELMDTAKRGRVYIETKKQPITDKNGTVSMVIGIAADITDYIKGQITLAQEVKDLRVQISRGAGPAIIGKSKQIVEVLGRMKAIAGTDTTVLITGESGTGKELVAEAIHHLSRRSKQPLIKVNCAALPESIIESELFGHVKGAFTGAVSNRIGRFEAANRGTIFLDEIGDISPAVQVRLLRVLEEKKVERVGDYKPIAVDVRIIAATNQNLRNLVEKGRFRQDLYYRLNVFNINIPPLRERMEDIPLLVAHFINESSRAMHKEISSVSDEVMKTLHRHNWGGNVRELMNVIESASVLCSGKTIQTEHLPPIFEPWAGTVDAAGDRDIREALRIARGNKAKAARLLGIHRSTLYRKMERYGIATD